MRTWVLVVPMLNFVVLPPANLHPGTAGTQPDCTLGGNLKDGENVHEYMQKKFGIYNIT